MRKTCLNCKQRKSVGQFYAHPAMRDGYLNRCKTCVRERAKANRNKNVEHWRDHDRKRGMLPHRVKARQAYMTTPQGKKAHNKAARKWRGSNPDKRSAHLAVQVALRANKLKKKPCYKCGSERVQAHHDDYNKPLKVVWACAKHHKTLDQRRSN